MSFYKTTEEIIYEIRFQILEELKEKTVGAFLSNQCLIPQETTVPTVQSSAAQARHDEQPP